MNPVPSDRQWLVLHQIDDGEVVPDGPGRWRAKAPIGWTSATGAVQRLYMLGLISLDVNGIPTINADGREVLTRRSVYDVLERVNRRRKNG